MAADLLTDLTAATKGSRDLSDRVLLTLGRVPDRYCGLVGEGTANRLDPTRNLQDAVDLVPDGCVIANIGQDDTKSWWVELRRGFLISFDEAVIARTKTTPALALCIALLKYMEKT